jgi:RNA polymerase sigma factor (TIGR02999 family)
MSNSSPDLTVLLARARSGDAEGSNELFELVQHHLRRIAGFHMQNERPNHTLQPTAVVNEVYLRLFGAAEGISWEDRTHFFAIAARSIRQVLIDHARKKRAEKRGGPNIAVTLSHAEGVVPDDQDFEKLDDVLTDLEKLDPQAARVVELKFFVGLEDKEIAETIGVSFARVRRDWEFARAWLRHQMGAA